MSNDLSESAYEILDELGIEVHDVDCGMVQMGDEHGGLYDPVSVERAEAACEAVADGSRYEDDEDRTATAYRFEAFHDALDAAPTWDGRRLAGARDARGLTQGELGERLGVGYQQVSAWERGERTPGAESLAKLARALDVTMDSLMGMG